MPSEKPKPVKAGSKPRPPLITPSASPPPNYGQSRTSAPPAKRPRLGSVAPRSQSRAASVAGSVPPESSHDLHYARKDSAQRLMDTWSQLAERYARPLDQDDIIDLRTKTLVLDHGSLRDTSGAIDFGTLTLNSEADTQDDVPDDEGEEEYDELDMLNPDAEISERILSQKAGVPPVREMDPADAADLQEFMELERKKREDFGDLEGDEAEYARKDAYQFSATEAEDNYHEGNPTMAGKKRRIRPPPLPPSSSPAPSDDSDDEFGSWQTKEPTLTYYADDADPTGSDDEGISLPPPSSSPGLPSSPIILSPPLSVINSASANKSVSGIVNRRQESPDLEIVPVRVSPTKRRAAPSTVKKGDSLSSSRLKSSISRSSKVVVQLQTPPRSTSSASLCRSTPSPDIVDPLSRRQTSDAASRPQLPLQLDSEDEQQLVITPVRLPTRLSVHQSEGSSSSARQSKVWPTPTRSLVAQSSPPALPPSRDPRQRSRKFRETRKSAMEDNSERLDKGKGKARAFSLSSPSCTDEDDHRERRGDRASSNRHSGKRKRASSEESSLPRSSDRFRSSPSPGSAPSRAHYEQRRSHVTHSGKLYTDDDRYAQLSSSSPPRRYQSSGPSRSEYDSKYYTNTPYPPSDDRHQTTYPVTHDVNTQYMIAQTLQTLQALMGGGIAAPAFPLHEPKQHFPAYQGYTRPSPRSTMRPFTPPFSSEVNTSRQWATSRREFRYDDHSSSPLPPSSPPHSSNFSSYGRRPAHSLPRSHLRARRVSFHTEVQHLSDPSESPNEAVSDPETRTRRSKIAQDYPVTRTKKSYRDTPVPPSILRSANHNGKTPHRTRRYMDTSHNEGYYSSDDAERLREHRRHPGRAHTPGPPDRR